MTVAALLDLGAAQDRLKEAIDSIRPLVSGFEVEISRVQKAGVDACDFHVILDEEHDNHDHDMAYLHGHDRADTHYHGEEHHHEEEHHHGGEHHHEGVHHHEHSHTGMREITDILNRAKLTDNARKTAFDIFKVLAEAESKAHNKPVDEVHFHEVGAVDSIVDIMAVAVCIDSLQEKYDITDIITSELYEGYGTVRCQHGILPIPVPAVVNIIEAHGLPVHFMEVRGEFVTPTGAAIAASLRNVDRLPKSFKIIRTGIGAGKRNYERPSILRAMIIEENDTDTIYKLESNIDDCSGEALGYVMERLFEAGARDVHYIPVYMKKNRPAYQLNVICTREDVPNLEEIIFRETTTIGIRRMELERTVLRREEKWVQTSIGEVAVKCCGDRAYPEYESLAKLCREKQLSYIDAYHIVIGEVNHGSIQ